MSLIISSNSDLLYLIILIILYPRKVNFKVFNVSIPYKLKIIYFKLVSSNPIFFFIGNIFK